jgi:sec-independent protein translocase protein TatA
MLGLSIGHIIILSFVVLLFGHRRLPELGHAFGRGMNAFKRGLDGKSSDTDHEEHELEGPHEAPKLSDKANHKFK